MLLLYVYIVTTLHVSGQGEGGGGVDYTIPPTQGTKTCSRVAGQTDRKTDSTFIIPLIITAAHTTNQRKKNKHDTETNLHCNQHHLNKIG